jgi:hypothetical protein
MARAQVDDCPCYIAGREMGYFSDGLMHSATVARIEQVFTMITGICIALNNAQHQGLQMI